MAAKKKPGRKAPAKKVAAVHRLREGMAKKRREPAHIAEDVTAPAGPQVEFDFRALGEAKLGQAKQANPCPEPGPEPGWGASYEQPWQAKERVMCEKAQAEWHDPTIPRDIHINIGRCSISLIFR